MRRLTLVFCAGGLLIGCVASLAGIPGVSADDSATSRQPKGPFPFFAMKICDARRSIFLADGASRHAQRVGL